MHVKERIKREYKGIQKGASKYTASISPQIFQGLVLIIIIRIKVQICLNIQNQFRAAR